MTCSNTSIKVAQKNALRSFFTKKQVFRWDFDYPASFLMIARALLFFMKLNYVSGQV